VCFSSGLKFRNVGFKIERNLFLTISWAFEVYRDERGVVLYWITRGSAVCFTFDRMISGPRTFLQKNGKKISNSHQVTNPYTVWTAWKIWGLSPHKEMISRQADPYISVAIIPNFLNVAHAVNFRPNTMKDQFDS